ncbi:hypothetical protein BX600DRAFT_548322 [Xylariales sp. PMI_506]|nr:hypothetical protein BX600DRAFT_548322 [Xylariales sp. PMI_506]
MKLSNMQLLYLLSAAPITFGAAVRGVSGSHPGKVLYFLENNPDGANIVSLEIAANGTLSTLERTSTGGKGLVGNTAKGPPAVDSMFSQDSVIVSSNYLFTVNPGSATLSMFNIPANDPAHPRLVGEPISTGGDFPNSVAYSPKNNLVCTSNTGARSGIGCFHVQADSRGLTAAGDFISLPINQTTPPLGPGNTFSDIVFNPSETVLFLTFKTDGTAPGTIYAFPVSPAGSGGSELGGLGSARLSKPAELEMEFSMSFLGGNDGAAFITDPTYGGSFVSITRAPTGSGCGGSAGTKGGASSSSGGDLAIVVNTKIVIPGQAATCWSRYGGAGDVVYMFDGGSPNITVVDARAPHAVLDTIAGAPGAGGSFDAVVDDAAELLYVLEAAPGVGVYALGASAGGAGRAVQNLNLTAFGEREFFQGLALYAGAGVY